MKLIEHNKNGEFEKVRSDFKVFQSVASSHSFKLLRSVQAVV